MRNILIVGGGGREHAIAWALTRSLGPSDTLFVAPGNGGTALMACSCTVKNVALHDVSQLVAFAKEENVSLVIPGPEGPLSLGITGSWQHQLG